MGAGEHDGADQVHAALAEAERITDAICAPVPSTRVSPAASPRCTMRSICASVASPNRADSGVPSNSRARKLRTASMVRFHRLGRVARVSAM